MAKFAVYAVDGADLWLDCQSDLLSSLNTRLVVPLRKGGRSDTGNRRLNPSFTIDGREYVMLTHLAAAVPATMLRLPVADLSQHNFEIGAALDMLISGF